MKKTLHLLITSIIITSTAIADVHLKSYPKSIEKNGYYLRADLGTSSALKLKDGNTYDNKVKRAKNNPGASFKHSKNDPGASF